MVLLSFDLPVRIRKFIKSWLVLFSRNKTLNIGRLYHMNNTTRVLCLRSTLFGSYSNQVLTLYLSLRKTATGGVLWKKVFWKKGVRNTLARASSVLRKRLWHNYFPVNFEKSLRAFFSRTPPGDCLCCLWLLFPFAYFKGIIQ